MRDHFPEDADAIYDPEPDDYTGSALASALVLSVALVAFFTMGWALAQELRRLFS